MTTATLAGLGELLANATPAPWGREEFTPLESDYSKIGHCNVILAPDGMSIVADLMKDPDIELVLAMHAALPSLLARIAALESENVRLALLAANGAPVFQQLDTEEQDALVDFIKSLRTHITLNKDTPDAQ